MEAMDHVNINRDHHLPILPDALLKVDGSIDPNPSLCRPDEKRMRLFAMTPATTSHIRCRRQARGAWNHLTLKRTRMNARTQRVAPGGLAQRGLGSPSGSNSSSLLTSRSTSPNL